MNGASDTQKTARGRRTLVALAALFFVPVMVAFWLYYGGSAWRPAGSSSKGELIDPARPLPSMSLPTPTGTATSEDFLRGKWTMLYVGDGRCDERCRKALYLSRQTRIALNKDMDRVQRVFLASGNCCDAEFLAREHPDLGIAILEGPGAAALTAQFPVLDDKPVAQAGRIYLIDPLGNLLMSYPEAAPDKALLQDMKKLLKLSHIG
jgi:cytochrome oxidase Cu insertion factor (SCO1/SenC/PrrC family)